MQEKLLQYTELKKSLFEGFFFNRYGIWLLPLFSAVLGIFTSPPFNIWPILFIALVPIFFFLSEKKGFLELFLGLFIYKLIFIAWVGYFVFEPIVFFLSALIFSFLSVPFFLISRYSKNVALYFLPFLWVFFEFIEAQYSIVPFYIITQGNLLGASHLLGSPEFLEI